MSLNSLVQESINNPPIDRSIPSTEGTGVTDPLAQARTEAFIKMADTSVENLELPGAKFSLDTINAANSAMLQERLQQEAIALRKEEAGAIEQQIMESPMTPEAAFGTIRDLREAIQSGTAPEDLAIQELSARNIMDAEQANQQDIALVQAVEDAEKYSSERMLESLRAKIGQEFDATIPGLEDAYEMLTSWTLFPKSGGTNVAGLMEDTFGIDVGFLEQLAPGNRIVELQKMWGQMDGPQRAAAIKRAHTSISKRAGIFFDNEEDAMVMMNALEAIAGSRVQAEASRVAGTTGQFIDTILTIAGGIPLKAIGKGAKAGKDLVVSGERSSSFTGVAKPITDSGDLVPNNLPVTNNLPATTTTQSTDVIRVVEGELVDEQLLLTHQKKQLGVDPLEGEFTDVSGVGRVEGRTSPQGPKITPDEALGGTPRPEILPDEALPSPKATLEETIEVRSGASKAGRDSIAKRREMAGILRGYAHTGAPAFSPAQVLNSVAPKTAGPILSDAIQDRTGNIAKGLGATRAQVADDTIVPNVGGGPIRRGASLLSPSMSHELSDSGASIINMMHDSKLYTGAEIKNVEENLGKVLGNLSSDEITLVNKSEAFIDEKAGRVSMNYTIGAGGGNSFSTAAEARGFISRLPSERLDTFEVLKFDSKQNQYVPFKGQADLRGEYLLRARYTHSRSSGASAEDVLRADTVNLLTNNVDSSVAYIKRMAQGISRLDIRQSQVAGLFKQILKPMEALKSKADLDDVWGALKDAEKLAEDFTQGQLTRRMGGDMKKVGAYRAVRRFYQAIYEVRNQQYRDLLSKKGYLTHMHPDGTNGWVKPIKDSDKVVTVWWDEAGTVVTKQELLDKGIELDILEGFKPRRADVEDGISMETPYVAVRKGKTDLQPLPSQVLHNKKTYLGRHMQARYVVEEFDNVVVNGTITQVGRVVAVANNPVDAGKAALGHSNRRSRRAIETTETDASYLTQELNQMHDLQMLTNTKHRLDFEQLDVTRQHSVVSPSESLDRVRNTMAKSTVLNEWVEYNTNKWVKTYGHLIKERGFPWGGEIKLKEKFATDPEAIRQLARARKVRERIQLTTGVHDMQIGEKIQQKLLGTGEWLSRAGANASKRGDAGLLRTMQVKAINTAARGVSELADYNVVNKAKSLAHLSFIVANPIRQLVMQSTSALMYAGVQHGSKYFSRGHAARDMAYLAMAKSYKDIDAGEFSKIVDKYAKAAGVNRDVAERFFKDFEDSGTMGSVSSHQFLEHGFSAGGSYRNHAGTYGTDEAPGFMGRVGHSLKGGSQTAIRSTSKYGFEAGEKANRIGAYLAVRNKHLVNGTLDQLDATDLGTEGLRLAGNMGQYNKAAFQAGALGLPFQFMSYTTRMIQYMLPRTKWTSWIASDVLSGNEKAKIGLWQAVMFGTGGLGVGSMFVDAAKDAGIEVDPLVHEALEEGLAGLGMEAVIEGLAGGDANINISGTMGPLSGLSGDLQVVFGKGERAATPLGQAYKIIADLATGLPVGFDDISGASSGAVGNLLGIAGNVSRIWSNPVLGMGEKLELQARDIAIMLPAVNNVLQARMMAATGEYMSKYGTPVAQVTIAEALSRGLIGVGPEQVSDTYELNAQLRGKRVRLLDPSHKELSTSGKDLANFTYNALQQLNNGQLSKDEVMNRIEASRAGAFMAYEDQTDRDILQASMRKELIRLTGSKETLADELVTLMASDLELTHELGWDKVVRHLEKLGPSQYKDFVISNIRRSQENESGSKLNFEPEL